MCWRQFSGDFEPDFLVKMSKLKFGQNSKSELWPRFWRWSFVDILMLTLGQCFEAGVWSRFWSKCLEVILKLNFDVTQKHLDIWDIRDIDPPPPTPPRGVPSISLTENSEMPLKQILLLSRWEIHLTKHWARIRLNLYGCAAPRLERLWQFLD